LSTVKEKYTPTTQGSKFDVFEQKLHEILSRQDSDGALDFITRGALEF
jgi:hypothetical protein